MELARHESSRGLFRQDAEWINKVGMHWHGREEIMVAHTAFHQTIFRNHSYRTDTVETRSVVPGVAVAVATETFEGFNAPDGRVWPKARNRLSYVLVTGPEGWKIAHGQNVEIDEVAAEHNPVKNNRNQ
ncbi:MAG: SgcJ/EcaC family oxidoreductase [Pirellulales bacterium]